MKLAENTGINEPDMELIEEKRPHHDSIYILGPVRLETIKTYIEIYLKILFIWLSKSLANTSILFHK